jgi:hypothetical protein
VNRRHKSAVVQNLLRSVSARLEGSSAHARGLLLRTLAILLAASAPALFPAASLHAQQNKTKVPIVGKLRTGNHQQAYSGKVQSLDLKQKILNVNSLQGQDTEIFPIKKNVRIEGLNGKKTDLKALRPGATVLIYFDQKSGERTIRNIVVLSSGKEQAKGKPAPSS